MFDDAIVKLNGTARVLDIVKSDGYVNNGGNVQIFKATDQLAQHWFIIGTGSTSFKIVPRTDMSLALTAYPSNADGTSSGTSSASRGNIYVATYDDSNSYQKWMIIDESGSYKSSSNNSVENATYYFNNNYYGKYLHKYDSTYANAASGYISTLGNTIRWKVTHVRDGRYTIQSSDDLTKYMYGYSSGNGVALLPPSSSGVLTDNYLWTLKVASGGGMLVRNVASDKYLYEYSDTSVSTTSTLGTAGSDEYKKRVWRIASTSFYGTSNEPTSHHELTSFTMNNVSVLLGQPINPKHTTTVEKPLWDSANDFEYSSSQNIITDYRTGTIIGARNGTSSVTVTHKVTSRTCKLTINVGDTLITDCCLVNSTKSVIHGAGNGSLALYDGITWTSSNQAVATVNNSGMVTGHCSGYSFITAKNSSGVTILKCEFQVMDKKTQKLSAMGYNEIQYLYCPTTYLNLWTQSLPNAFETKVDLLYCLRAYYTLPENNHPTGNQLKTILKNELDLTIDSYTALWLFNECYLGYLGRYNPNYLNNARKQYFNYLKEIVAFCAFSMAGNLDPVNTASNCNGYDDLAYDLSREWGHNESSNKVMLGSNGYQGKYYYEEAQKVGYRFFYAPNYEDFCSEYGSDFVRSVNIRYIQRCLESGCEFLFCNDPRTAPLDSSLHMEYSYLLNYYTDKWGVAYFKYDAESCFWYFSKTP